MKASDHASRKHPTTPDDFLQDYISDVWGLSRAEVKETPAQSIDVEVPVSTIKNIEENVYSKPYCRIASNLSLVPTLKYPSSHTSSQLASQTDSLVLLFWNLYFLRRPLSPRVRKYILDCSEQIIEDFHAVYWLQQLSIKGAYSEV